MKKRCILIILLFVCSFTVSYAQSDIPRVRVGAKLGIPNIAGGELEVVTPLLENRVAPFIGYSGFSLEIDEVDTGISFFEIGSNVYFNNQAKGIYATLSYGNLNIEGTYSDAETIDGELFTGDAEGELDLNLVNVKLGAKLGRKLFFRVEIGYGFGDIPEEVVITGNVNGTPETGVEEIPEIPGIGTGGLPLFNIGVGYSF